MKNSNDPVGTALLIVVAVVLTLFVGVLVLL